MSGIRCQVILERSRSSTRLLYTWISNSSASRWSSSTTHRSVPCRLSRNGETRAMRGLGSMLSGGNDKGLCDDLRCNDLEKTEQNAHEEPQIGVRHVILVVQNSAIHLHEK